MTEAVVHNPFCPPGLAGNPNQPLRPWDDGLEDHHRYYVPVDRTEHAFEDFEKATENPEAVATSGRLVLVTGKQGCGKTSLINRCLWSYRKRLGLNFHVVIADLTEEGADNQPVPERVQHVATMLIDFLQDYRVPGRRQPLFEDTVVRELRARSDNPRRFYKGLSRQLQSLADREQIAVAVLLPPSADLAKEIIEYASLVAPRLLFFAETAFLEPHGDWLSQLNRSARQLPLVLSVGPLNPDDYARFTGSWLSLHPGPQVPPLAPGVMDVVNHPNADLTLEHLQKLMFGVYDDVLRRDPLPAEVTQQDFLRFMMGEWAQS